MIGLASHYWAVGTSDEADGEDGKEYETREEAEAVALRYSLIHEGEQQWVLYMTAEHVSTYRNGKRIAFVGEPAPAPGKGSGREK